jgi:hypothetical protein
MKEKTIKITEKQEKIIKKALDTHKDLKKIAMPRQGERREEIIEELYEIEKIEKQLK